MPPVALGAVIDPVVDPFVAATGGAVDVPLSLEEHPLTARRVLTTTVTRTIVLPRMFFSFEGSTGTRGERQV
jgi:hypothetical protein